MILYVEHMEKHDVLNTCKLGTYGTLHGMMGTHEEETSVHEVKFESTTCLVFQPHLLSEHKNF